MEGNAVELCSSVRIPEDRGSVIRIAILGSGKPARCEPEHIFDAGSEEPAGSRKCRSAEAAGGAGDGGHDARAVKMRPGPSAIDISQGRWGHQPAKAGAS